MRLRSNPVAILVREASIAFVSRTPTHARFAEEAPPATWFHRNATGYDLFLLKSSPVLPSVIYSNRRIASLTEPVQAAASVSSAPAPRVRHVVWIGPGSVLQVIRIAGDALPTGPLPFPLLSADLRIIEPPLTGADGTLRVILASPLEEAIFLRIPDAGKPEFSRLPFPLPASSVQALWYQDEVLALA